MWLLSGRCRSEARVDNKVIIITGANSGIGKATAIELVRRGGTVVMANRSVERSNKAMKEIRTRLAQEQLQLGFPSDKKFGTIDFVQLDTSSLESVRRCGCILLQKYPQINILINNAGVASCNRAVTEDGIELQMATNHIGPFLLTCILLPRLIQSKPSRIINVSSCANLIVKKIDFDNFNGEKSYSPFPQYSVTKLANIILARDLTNRFKERNITDVTTYSLHPGVVATGISRHISSAVIYGGTFFWNRIMGPFMKTPEQGAQTTLYCALDEKAGNESGFYYSGCKKSTPARRAFDQKTAELLWKKSVELTKMNWDPFNPNADPATSIASL